MAKKYKRSAPVAAPKKDPNKIILTSEDLPKERGCPIPPVRPCDHRRKRTRALETGRSRKPKHKGKRDW